MPLVKAIPDLSQEHLPVAWQLCQDYLQQPPARTHTGELAKLDCLIAKLVKLDGRMLPLLAQRLASYETEVNTADVYSLIKRCLSQQRQQRWENLPQPVADDPRDLHPTHAVACTY